MTGAFLANLLALAFVFSWLRESIPQPVADSAHFLGQATVPVATLLLAIRTYGGDLHRIGSIYLFAYALSLLTIPFWVALLPYAG